MLHPDGKENIKLIEKVNYDFCILQKKRKNYYNFSIWFDHHLQKLLLP